MARKRKVNSEFEDHLDEPVDTEDPEFVSFQEDPFEEDDFLDDEEFDDSEEE